MEKNGKFITNRVAAVSDDELRLIYDPLTIFRHCIEVFWPEDGGSYVKGVRLCGSIVQCCQSVTTVRPLTPKGIQWIVFGNGFWLEMRVSSLHI
jgi:hypothetical protein